MAGNHLSFLPSLHSSTPFCAQLALSAPQTANRKQLKSASSTYFFLLFLFCCYGEYFMSNTSLPCYKQTALHWAAKHGNEDMAALVAEAGADVNTKSVSK